jgi:outer membrane translocation and assembly module TamA
LAPLEIEIMEPSQIVEADQIKEMYWSYGKEFARLKSKDAEQDVWKSKYYDDLNFHVETKDGNDGKNVEITVENDEGQLIDLTGIVSESNVVFEKVFKEYDSH